MQIRPNTIETNTIVALEFAIAAFCTTESVVSRGDNYCGTPTESGDESGSENGQQQGNATCNNDVYSWRFLKTQRSKSTN